MGLLAPFIACDGAVLWNTQAGAGLVHIPVQPELAKEIVTLGRGLGAIANVESDDEWFTDRMRDLERDSIIDYEISEPDGVGSVDE
ncbi:hypothetical protein SMA90_33075, partial [Escherichia coli]